MPARTGRQYLNGLREQDREVWLAGERVKDVTSHPGLKNGARAIASLYDMQTDPKLRDEMTYISPTTGDRVGLSFIIPRTREDLEKRRVMMLNWARTTCGLIERPDPDPLADQPAAQPHRLRRLQSRRGDGTGSDA
jgi:4-hydroxyphenylacetate 3-monooxygenase